MSDTHITDEGPPLDPHTLRVVIEHISHLRAQYAGAGFQDHEWALANAAAIISRLLATTSDRARVVVLPEPSSIGDDHAHWSPKETGTVCRDITGGTVTMYSDVAALSCAGTADLAAILLAAAEFAGGAQ